MLHLCGNVRQWIISAVGAEPDTRDRDAEFATCDGISTAELRALLDETVSAALLVLDHVPQSTLTRRIAVQGKNPSVLEAIYTVLSTSANTPGKSSTSPSSSLRPTLAITRISANALPRRVPDLGLELAPLRGVVHHSYVRVRILQTTSIALIAFVAMAFSSAWLFAGTVHSNPAPCHQHEGQSPSPSPVNHNCCEISHQAASIASSDLAFTPVDPVAAERVVLLLSTVAVPATSTLATSLYVPDTVPLRI